MDLRGRGGVERAVAALAQHKAVKAGEDPSMAADIAEGEAAIRRILLSVRCPWCKAGIAQQCVDYRRRPLRKTLIHPSRRELVEGSNYQQGAA